jgi:hypothetical protein
MNVEVRGDHGGAAYQSEPPFYEGLKVDDAIVVHRASRLMRRRSDRSFGTRPIRPSFEGQGIDCGTLARTRRHPKIRDRSALVCAALVRANAIAQTTRIPKSPE